MPLDRGIIDQQLQALGDSARWWNERELRDLPSVLYGDEQILAISRGKIARLRWLRRSWLIVVTDRRLLCMRSSGTSWRQLEVPAGQIYRAALRVGPFHGRVLVVAAGHKFRLLVPRDDAYRLMTALSGLGTHGQQPLLGFAPTRLVQRVIGHVLALPAAALGPDAPRPLPTPPAPDTAALEQRVQVLEAELNELRQQVDFLEQLLRDRHDLPGSVLPPGRG